MNLETNGDFIYRLFMLTNWSPHSLKAVVKLSVSLFSFSERGTMGNSKIVGAQKLCERLQIVKKIMKFWLIFFKISARGGQNWAPLGKVAPLLKIRQMTNKKNYEVLIQNLQQNFKIIGPEGGLHWAPEQNGPPPPTKNQTSESQYSHLTNPQ